MKQWPKDGPPLLWKATGLGIGHATVSVVGDRIYTMGDGPESGYVRCFSMKDQKQIWSAKCGRPGGDRRAPGGNATPTVDGDMVYAMGQFGDLVALKAADGEVVWQKSMKKDFGGAMMSGWGYSESPTIDGEKLICTPGGSGGAVVALNKKTGATIWQTKDFTDEAGYSSVVPAEIGGVKQYVQWTGQNVVGIAPETGKILWKANRPGKTAVIPTPIIHEDHVFVTSGYGIGCNLFKISRSADTFKAEEVYANTEMTNHHGGVVRIGEHVYGYSDARGKGWTCLEMKSGKSVWNSDKLGKGSIAFADGHLVCRAEGGKGTIVLIEATPSGWVEKGRFDQPERSRAQSWAQPVIADGKLFIRDQDVLLCYDLKAR
jgi:outer membrane protein assembly factor BamB